jgi:(methylthio)acryloyl-CoA hydratase
MHNSENTADPTHSVPNGLSVSQEGPVTLLRLSRPAKRNALDRDMIAGIEAFFRSPPDGTRAVVLHGEGSNFSAGLDLSDVAEIGVAESISHSRAWHRAFEQIEYGHVPVVVVMHGAVIGGGLELAAAAHIRVSERSAYILRSTRGQAWHLRWRRGFGADPTPDWYRAYDGYDVDWPHLWR